MAWVGPLLVPGAAEVGEDVARRASSVSAQGDDLGQRPGDAVADRVDELGHQFSAAGPVGLAVGGDVAVVLLLVDSKAIR